MILNRKKSYKIDVRCELYQTRTVLQSYDEGQLTIQVHRGLRRIARREPGPEHACVFQP